MKKLKLILVMMVIAGLVAVFSLASCKAEEAVEEEAVEEVKEAVEEEAVEEVEEKLSGEFDYLCYWDKGHVNDQYIRSIIAEFEAETGIKVNITNPGRDVLNKIRPAILEGNPPDLFDGHGIEMWPALIKDELLMSTEDLFTGPTYDNSGTMEDQFFEGIDQSWAVNGVRYFVPYNAHTSGIWYNKALFQEKGFDVPTNWDDLITISNQLIADGMTPFTEDNVDFYNAYYYYWFSNRISGPGVFYDAAMDPTGEGWDNPELLEAAQWVEKLAKGGYFIDGWEGYVWPAGQIDFVQAKAAMLLCGSWVVNETFDKVAEGFEFGHFPFPLVSGGKGSLTDVEFTTLGWGIPGDAENSELAKEFIRFALQPKYQVKWFDTYYYPAITGLGDQAPEDIKDVVELMESAESTHEMYDGLQAEAEWWTTVFLPLDDKLIFGNITAEEFIESVKAGTIEFHSK